MTHQRLKDSRADRDSDVKDTSQCASCGYRTKAAWTGAAHDQRKNGRPARRLLDEVDFSRVHTEFKRSGTDLFTPALLSRVPKRSLVTYINSQQFGGWHLGIMELQ